MSPNLRELRREFGLTQRQLAQQMRASHIQIQRVEKGTRRLTEDFWGRALLAARAIQDRREKWLGSKVLPNFTKLKEGTRECGK